MSAVLPAEMRCVVAPVPGGPEAAVIDLRPLPQARDDEVLVQVLASSVSRPDTIQRQGLYPPPPGAPDVLGLELAGEIVHLGNGVTGWSVGDAVCALTIGGNAEFCAVPAAQLLPVPRGWTMLEAASLPENLCTAWDSIVRRGNVQAGEHVLVHGGSSGLGSMAIQLAKVLGAHVAATAGSARKTDFCLALGADTAINYREVDFLEAVMDWTGDRGVDFIVDLVGVDYTTRNLQALALDGRLSVLATLAEESTAGVDLRLMLRRRLTIQAATLKARSPREKASVIKGLRRDVWPHLESGAIAPAIDSVYPMSEVAQAHSRLESSQHMGKIILDTGADA